MYSYFTHPNQVCMSYITHFKFAMSLSQKLLIGSIESFIHAFFPNLYQTSTSDLIVEIKKDLENNGCEKYL